MAYFRSNVSGGIPAGVKNLPTMDTASGSIATFDTDLTENLVEVKCQIVAKQASGTPSPVNPLPITTYTEMNVSHSGKNLFDEIYPSMGTLKYKSIFVGKGTFTMSTDLPTRTDTYANLFFLANQVSSGADSALNGVYNNRPITVTSTDGYVTIAYRYDQYNPEDYHTQIEVGTTATAYEPYNGTTKNIPFGQAVANGVIDITTGKLRVTQKYYSYTEVLYYGTYGSDNANLYYMEIPNYTTEKIKNISNSTYAGALFSNMLSKISTVFVSDMKNNEIRTQGNSAPRYFYFRADSFASLADLNAVLANTPLQVVAELETPIEIQLDSITLQALLNENNIWCDTGDTEVKFLLTVGKKIS